MEGTNPHLGPHFNIPRFKIMGKCTAAVCAVTLVLPGEIPLLGQSQETKKAAEPAEQEAAKIPPDQLDSLVAPIALYPDELLAQTLAASTYPLEIIQLQQWLAKNSKLKDKKLAKAVAKQPWDPSVQAMAALPDVVKRLADDIQWATDLGNAFLAQQSDVMDAVQRMRQKAKEKGNLKSNEQQKVESKTVENKTVIVVEQSDPQVVYVPSYNPVVVYGAPVYAYPAVYYPPPGYYAAGMAISFGVGVAMGAMWSGGWGWGCGWGNNNVQINNYNNFNRSANVNRNTNINRNANVNRSNNSTNWSHNAQHRGGAPYRDRATANQYGGTARGESVANRQANTQQRASQQSANPTGNRSAANGTGNRTSRSSGSSSTGSGSTGSRPSRSGGSSSTGSPSAFGGGGYNGSSARAASNRGSSSSRSGGSRGGGGRGRR
jgi:hypothetical protein